MSNITQVLGTVAMDPKGEYDSSAYYEKLNMVTYDDSTYIATKPSHEVLPTDTEYWQYMTGGLSKDDIVDSCNSTAADKMLSAKQGKMLNDRVNKRVIYFNNVAALKDASHNTVSIGDLVVTKGYYAANDGGGAEYIITDTASLTDYQEALNNDGLYATLIINGSVNALQLGAINDGTTNNSTVFTKLFTLQADEIIIPEGAYLLNSKIVLSSLSNKRIINYGKIKFASSNVADTSGFELNDCTDIIFDGFNIESTRDNTSYPPSGHTRVTSYSSNIVGFKILKCENIKFFNSKFKNLEYDIRATKRSSDPDETFLTKNIVIDGMYSRNSSQSIYAQNIDGLYINNADIISAADLGDGDHILYTSEYSKNIYVNNSILKSPDSYLGNLFNIQETHYNTNAAAPVDFHANNLTTEGRGLISLKSTTKSYFTNVSFKMINNSSDNSQRVFNPRGTSYVEMNNCNLETTKYIYSHYEGTPKVIIKNSTLKGSNSYALFIAQSAGSCDVLLKDSVIENQYAILDIASGMTSCSFVTDNCIYKTGHTFSFASRNPSGNNKVRIMNCCLTNTDTSSTVNFSYNGSGNDMTGYEVLSNYLYGYTRIAGTTTNGIILNTYINNVSV